MTVERGKRGREGKRPKRGWVAGNPRYCRARARRHPERKDITMGKN